MVEKDDDTTNDDDDIDDDDDSDDIGIMLHCWVWHDVTTGMLDWDDE